MLPILILLLVAISYPLSHWMAMQPWWVQCNVMMLLSASFFMFAGWARRWARK